MKELTFKTELSKFENDDIRHDTETMINFLPDYFFTTPASSTGKYHPLCDLGECGLVRHTKAVCRIAEEYFRDDCYNLFDSRKRDLIRMTLILHDGLKNGFENTGYTLLEHPLLIAKYIEDNKKLLSLSDNEIATVSRLISCHMGPWAYDKNGKQVLPIPSEYDELFVHNCDYIASRRFLNFEFDGNELIEEHKIKLSKGD